MRPSSALQSPVKVYLMAAVACLGLAGADARAIDLATLWDFARPEISEQRFRTALETARGDDALILRTQIARTHGLRRDFDTARRLLQDLEPELAGAGPEARVRYHLELGRTYASAAHPPALRTPEALAQARREYERALAGAQAHRLDGLAIDAIHMFAFVDPAPADQLKWGEAALAIATTSSQPEARRWEASIRNNVGLALHALGRHAEALDQFRRALALREQRGDAQATHVARWMVAWTLRSLGRLDEALEIQLALARQADADGRPDRHVFDELEALYRLKGDAAQAEQAARRRSALAGGG